MNPLELISEDWKSIPRNNRYFIISGSALLFIDWITDHWGRKYTYFGLDFHQWFFNIGVSLIILGFVLIILKQFISLSLLTHYRDIYAVDKLNQSFSIVSFNGRMILFDKRNTRKKEAYHIETADTATDLGFWGSEIHVPINYGDAVQNGVEMGDPINVKIKDYKYMGAINTRR